LEGRKNGREERREREEKGNEEREGQRKTIRC
jgi:hypothetical protein